MTVAEDTNTHAAHETLVLERTLGHAPSRVFSAFANAEARAIWGPPTPDLNMQFKHADFRVGGSDLCICGPGPAEGVRVETFYHAIEADRRIVFAEVIGMGDAPESVCLVTVELAGATATTDLKIVIQATSLGGPEMIAEVKGGWTASLENLAAYLG